MAGAMNSFEEFGRQIASMLAESQLQEKVVERGRRRLFASRRRSHGAWRLGLGVRVLVPAVLGTAVVLGFLRPWEHENSVPLSFTVGPRGSTGVVGAWVASGGATDLQLDFSDGTRMELPNGSRARVTSVGASGASIVLEKGSVRAAVHPTKNSQWQLSVGPVVIRVIGTRFQTDWDPVGEAFHLRVDEGVVATQGCVFGQGLEVTAGQEVHAHCGATGSGMVGASPTSNPSSQPAAGSTAREPLAHPAGSSPMGIDGRIPRDRGSSEVASDSPADAAVLQAPDAGPRQDWRSLAAAHRWKEALAEAERDGFEQQCELASATDLLALGDAARFSGNTARSVLVFQTIRRRFPGQAAASSAAFSLGCLYFDVMHDYSSAAAWFSRYCSESPGGSYGREALGRLMEALERAGDASGARATATRYLGAYPTGPHAAQAERIANGK